MSSDAEKGAVEVTGKSPSPSESLAHKQHRATAAGVVELPPGWKYKQIRVLNKTLPWYASPPVQLLLVSFVCFLCPGMFNALSGLGGGGNVDHEAQNNANTALYSTFAVVGFCAGSVANKIGVKLTLSLGGIGYCIYVCSFLAYSYTANDGFNIFAGALLGVCAGLLWTAQGAIMMGYPDEGSKGRYISWFWIIFNLGGVLGALIPLGQDIHTKTNSTASTGTYIGFIVLTFLGAVLAFSLVSSRDVIRKDGSKVILMKSPTWWSEIKGLALTFREDPWVLLLFPMFWSSNWFTTYQFNDVNGAFFNTRTRSLNNLLYWIAQMIGAMVFGYCLDVKWLRRSTRARVVWAVLLALTMAIWGGGYAFQRTYTRESIALINDKADPHPERLYDWTTSGYLGPMFLYLFYGFYDAAFQTCVYWFMGALTNNGRKLANFAGFYKGIQSAGAAVTWSLDNHEIPYMNMLASCWALLAGSLLVAAPLVLLKIKDHSSVEHDLAFSDETYDEVAAQTDKA